MLKFLFMSHHTCFCQNVAFSNYHILHRLRENWTRLSISFAPRSASRSATETVFSNYSSFALLYFCITAATTTSSAFSTNLNLFSSIVSLFLSNQDQHCWPDFSAAVLDTSRVYCLDLLQVEELSVPQRNFSCAFRSETRFFIFLLSVTLASKGVGSEFVKLGF